MNVLILVIVDYGGSASAEDKAATKRIGFNPCYSGLWRIPAKDVKLMLAFMSFNPCYSGLWRINLAHFQLGLSGGVLILVIVDYGGSAWVSVFCKYVFSVVRKLRLLKLRQLELVLNYSSQMYGFFSSKAMSCGCGVLCN